MRRFERRVNAVATVLETLTAEGVEVGGQAVAAFKEGAFPVALRDLRAKVDEMLQTIIARTDVEPIDDVVLTQWLIAKELNVKEAFNGIQGFASFRDLTRGGVLPSGPWLQQGMCQIPFEDRLGRPVIFVQARYHRPGNVEGFVRGVRASIDVCMAHMLAKRRTEAHVAAGFGAPNLLEQYVLVFDFEGASWSQVDYDAMHATFRVGTREYPNRLGQIVALNVGGAWRICWKVCRSVMHARTRRKTLIVAPHKVHKTMRQMVTSPDMLPPCYGGTGPAWKEPHEFRSFEDQAGALAAATYLRAGVVPFGARPPACDLDPVEATDLALPEPEQDTEKGGLSNWSFGCCVSQRAR